jgi:hypothetical protein
MKIQKKTTQQQQNKTRWKIIHDKRKSFASQSLNLFFLIHIFHTISDWYRKVLPQACTHDDYVHWRVSAINKQNQDAES